MRLQNHEDVITFNINSHHRGNITSAKTQRRHRKLVPYPQYPDITYVRRTKPFGGKLLLYLLIESDWTVCRETQRCKENTRYFLAIQGDCKCILKP